MGFLKNSSYICNFNHILKNVSSHLCKTYMGNLLILVKSGTSPRRIGFLRKVYIVLLTTFPFINSKFLSYSYISILCLSQKIHKKNNNYYYFSLSCLLMLTPNKYNLQEILKLISPIISQYYSSKIIFDDVDKLNIKKGQKILKNVLEIF